MDARAAFCLWCGAPLERRMAWGRLRAACTRCDFVHFVGPVAAVCAAVVREREVLLVRRANRPHAGAWGLPGGFQDHGEDAATAAAREVREETGLVVCVERLLGVHWVTDDPHKHTNVTAWLATPTGGEMRAADDAIEARFWPLDRLPETIAFASNRQILSQLGDLV